VNRDPIPLRDVVNAVTRELGMPPADALARVADAWNAVAGSALAGHSRVRSVRDGEAVIEVDGPAWATQIRYLANDLVEGLDKVLGGRTITTLKVVVGGPRKAV
jgi:predicted nucleic acid-binding Zn ribbon protein